MMAKQKPEEKITISITPSPLRKWPENVPKEVTMSRKSFDGMPTWFKLAQKYSWLAKAMNIRPGGTEEDIARLRIAKGLHAHKKYSITKAVETASGILLTDELLEKIKEDNG
jgi:hypothetical protein